ncbi:MAG: hypothetical protein A3D90_08665 [Sulfuricurvum sp. RIFCSPHIGHO2_02_FULL_43_9]|nr:MAG: hypothetical protein A3D90_08665 [Sulfuricurvum sp. RIFCSPHIGHO2_02_FULL_43_9]
MDSIQNSIYRLELFARHGDYSVGPKRPQPVQTAQILEAKNQADYRESVPTPQDIQLQNKAAGLGKHLDVIA